MSTAPHIALMSALALPEADGNVPDWIMVLPPPGKVETQDARGPYSYADPGAIIAASMLTIGRDLPIDINHSIDLRGPKGEEAPARGWIKELQARADGIWARVEWSREGAALLADRAYRFISPVLGIDAKDGKTVRTILRASLVNRPNLRGLPALNQENASMTLMERLAAKLGQPKDATEDALLAAIPAATDTALQSAMTEIGTVLGIEGGDPAAILAAARGTKAGATTVTALQAQVTTLQGQIATLEAAGARTAAEVWMADQLKAHVIPTDQHETLITLHMEKPELAAKVAAAWPALGPGHTAARPPKAGATITSLNAEQAARKIHADAVALQTAEKNKGIELSLADAITKVTETR